MHRTCHLLIIHTDDGNLIPGLTDFLKVNLSDPHCKLILFGGVIDERITKVLQDNVSATEKLMIFKNSRGGRDLSLSLPKIQQCWFQGIFRDVEHRPKCGRPKPVIYRNAIGQRIDPPIKPVESITSWLRHKKFCNNYFLRGECPDERCMARHDGRLDREELNGLQYLARGLPCRQSNNCRDPICYAGHHCPVPTCFQMHCKFYGDMHISDLSIVSEDG